MSRFCVKLPWSKEMWGCKKDAEMEACVNPVYRISRAWDSAYRLRADSPRTPAEGRPVRSPARRMGIEGYGGGLGWSWVGALCTVSNAFRNAERRTNPNPTLTHYGGRAAGVESLWSKPGGKRRRRIQTQQQILK